MAETKLKTLVITRTYLDKVTLGDTVCYDENGILQWNRHSIELPNKNNQPKISCIPEGKYICKWTFSPGFNKWTYLVAQVNGRSGIRIHVANYTSELLGCIAPCNSHADLNHDGIIDGASSGKALKLLEDTMKKLDFKLIIKAK